MTSFLDLPNELLQRIASFLPFSALLQLKCVNRRTQSICDDRFVLRDIAQYGLFNTSGAVEKLRQTYCDPDRIDLAPEQFEWREGVAFLDTASAEEMRNVAYAVERCIEGALDETDDWTLRKLRNTESFDIGGWLPLMLALHHPAALVLEPDTFLRIHEELSKGSAPVSSLWATRVLRSMNSTPSPEPQEADMINVNFILIYVTLQRLGTTRKSIDIIRLFEDFFFPPWTDSAKAQSREEEPRVIEDTLKRLRERVPRWGEHTSGFTLAQAFAVLVPLIVELAVQFPATDHPGDLIKPAQMDFQDFMAIPSPRGSCAMSFTTCHLPTMTSPEFLCGRWRGYYTDQRAFLRRRGRQGTFDPAMCNVRIVAKAPQQLLGVSACIDRSSRGTDAHGEFALNGQVLGDGSISLVKSYIVMGWSWIWTGRVTPFGWVGTWGSPLTTGGYFWLWKEDWA